MSRVPGQGLGEELGVSQAIISRDETQKREGSFSKYAADYVTRQSSIIAEQELGKQLSTQVETTATAEGDLGVSEKDPSEEQQEKKKKKAVNPFLAFSYADWIDGLLILIAVLSSAGIGICMPLNILVFGDGVSGAGTGDMERFNKMSLNLTIIGAVGLVCGFLSVCLFEISAERQTGKIKQLYFRTVLRQEIGYFDVKDIGTLASDVNTSCVQIREGINMKVGQIVRGLVMFVGGYTVALVKDWKMALLMMVIIPCLAISFMVLIRTIGKSSERSKLEYAKAGSIVEESLPAARTIASFNLENVFKKRFKSQLGESLSADISGAVWKSIAIGTIFLFLFLSYALGWWWGGRTMKRKIIDSLDFEYGGVVLTTFFAVVISAFSIASIGPNFSSLGTAAQAVVSLRELISRESLIDPYDDRGEKPPSLNGDISFQNVAFAYPSRPERNVYGNVSFDIRAGETVALVGPSGCGKSTVIQLIERFYDVTGGKILFNGDKEIRTLNVQWLRSQMALVSQEPKLFCTSIKDNIRFGKPTATDEEILQAAKDANAHGFISALADGYNTVVGQGGSLLSGGQKQRIAIARAILRNPSILILDEATSALDNQSEKIVQEALDRLVALGDKQRTTIIIAHRLSTIRTAKRIIVFNQNEANKGGSVVVENGTHEELMKIENGLYKMLVEAQMQGFEDARPEPLDNRARLSSVDLDALAKHQRKLSKKLSKELEKDTPLTRKGMSGGSRSMTPVGKSTLREPLLPEEKGKAKDVNASRQLFMRTRPDWPVFFTGILSASAVGVSTPFNGFLIASFVGAFFEYDPLKSREVNGQKIEDRANFLAIFYIVLAVGVFAFNVVQSFCFDYTGYRLVNRMRYEIYENMVHQDMEFFDNPQHNTGFLSSVLSADCEFSRNLLGQNLSLLCQNTVSLIAAMTIGLLASWRLALVTGAMYSLLIPAALIQVRLIQATSTRISSEEKDLESPAFVFNEAVTNLRTVAAYGLQPVLEARHREALALYLAKGYRNAYTTGVACGITDGLMFFTSAVAYKYAQVLMSNNTLGLEKMMRCNMAISMAGNAVARSAAWSSDKKRAAAACENIFYILNRKPKMDSRSPLGATPAVQGNVQVVDTKFRYPGRPTVPVLASVTFDVKPGETVALVGESGSGKSTIIQFLERFYDLEASHNFREQNDKERKLQAKLVSGVAKVELEGENASGLESPFVLLDDASEMFGGRVDVEKHHIQDINLAFLRDQLGLVGQEPVLFDISIAENIQYGKPGASQEEIQKAAKLANAHEFIVRQPEGYNTKVGKGGCLLSGGQKQRIAIARAVIKDPKILLLDEATSALDPESESVVQKALDDLLKERPRTTIVIAHRLSTIRNADKIVVFKPEPGVGSRIVECGTHSALMQIENGIYRNLVVIATK